MKINSRLNGKEVRREIPMDEKYEIIESDVEIPVDEIEIFKINCKQDMIDSIKERGMMVRPKLFKLNPDDDKYMIDDGRRRLSIVKYDLGWETVRCDIVNTDGLLSSLIYNFQRSPNPMMEARHIHELLTEHDYTQKELAHELGCTQSKISKRLNLLNLIPELQDKLERGEIPKSVGYELSKLPDEKQHEIAESDDTITLKDVKEEKRMQVVQNLDMERIEEGPEEVSEKKGEAYADMVIKRGGRENILEYDGSAKDYRDIITYLNNAGFEVEYKYKEIIGGETDE